MHPNINKSTLFSCHNLYVKKSDIHRFGVFTAKNLEEGDLIEESPMLYLPHEEIGETTINSHCYSFSDEYSIIGLVMQQCTTIQMTVEILIISLMITMNVWFSMPLNQYKQALS